MRVLKADATDAEIVDAIWEWLELLAQGRYQDACEWFADDARFTWKARDLERRIVRFFGGLRSRRPLPPPAELRARVEIHRYSEAEADYFTSRNVLPTVPVAQVGFFIPVRGNRRGCWGIWTTCALRPGTTGRTKNGLVFDFEVFHL